MLFLIARRGRTRTKFSSSRYKVNARLAGQHASVFANRLQQPLKPTCSRPHLASCRHVTPLGQSRHTPKSHSHSITSPLRHCACALQVSHGGHFFALHHINHAQCPTQAQSVANLRALRTYNKVSPLWRQYTKIRVPVNTAAICHTHINLFRSPLKKVFFEGGACKALRSPPRPPYSILKIPAKKLKSQDGMKSLQYYFCAWEIYSAISWYFGSMYKFIKYGRNKIKYHLMH
jgi:hypothetical protein